MKGIELLRWGLPLAVLVGSFKLSGAAVSLAFAGIVFALLSAAIAWHKRDPHGFHTGVRAWIIVLLIAPAVLLTIGTALGAPPFLVVSVPYLLLTIWLYRKNASKIQKHNAVNGSPKGSY